MGIIYSLIWRKLLQCVQGFVLHIYRHFSVLGALIAASFTAAIAPCNMKINKYRINLGRGRTAIPVADPLSRRAQSFNRICQVSPVWTPTALSNTRFFGPTSNSTSTSQPFLHNTRSLPTDRATERQNDDRMTIVLVR